jgi:hypothetical protein
MLSGNFLTLYMQKAIIVMIKYLCLLILPVNFTYAASAKAEIAEMQISCCVGSMFERGIQRALDVFAKNGDVVALKSSFGKIHQEELENGFIKTLQDPPVAERGRKLVRLAFSDPAVVDAWQEAKTVTERCLHIEAGPAVQTYRVRFDRYTLKELNEKIPGLVPGVGAAVLISNNKHLSLSPEQRLDYMAVQYAVAIACSAVPGFYRSPLACSEHQRRLTAARAQQLEHYSASAVEDDIPDDLTVPTVRFASGKRQPVSVQDDVPGDASGSARTQIMKKPRAR